MWGVKFIHCFASVLLPIRKNLSGSGRHIAWSVKKISDLDLASCTFFDIVQDKLARFLMQVWNSHCFIRSNELEQKSSFPVNFDFFTMDFTNFLFAFFLTCNLMVFHQIASDQLQHYKRGRDNWQRYPQSQAAVLTCLQLSATRWLTSTPSVCCKLIVSTRTSLNWE